jgi:hypothetical protein
VASVRASQSKRARCSALSSRGLDLDRDVASELCVVRPVHFAHTTAPDRRVYAIDAELRAGREALRRGLLVDHAGVLGEGATARSQFCNDINGSPMVVARNR